MKVDIALVISLAAILSMLYCLFLVLSLKKNVPGGIVGSKWNVLTSLVGLFTLGYLATPFLGKLPEQVLRLMVSCIFFFGAIYVAVTVKLIYRIIRELSE